MEVLKGIVESNISIAKDVFEMVLYGDFCSKIKSPGQFLSIKVDRDSMLLRRPISISDYDYDKCTIIYKTFGDGTKYLSSLDKGKELDVLYPLGNGFEDIKKDKNVLIIGGGVGVPPLYKLSKELKQNNCNITCVLGFSGKEDVFYEQKFYETSNTFVATMDGTYKNKGTVIDVILNRDLIEGIDAIYACGPNKMLLEIQNKFNYIETYLSLEERMACTIGACYGCVCKTKDDSYKLVCKDGPVFRGEEVIL